MKIHNMEQCSPEWFDIRAKKMTASHASEIGDCGKGLESYIIKMMAEAYSSGEKEHFSNIHTACTTTVKRRLSEPSQALSIVAATEKTIKDIDDQNRRPGCEEAAAKPYQDVLPADVK